MLRLRTVGIVGLGGIGREVARLAKALGMRVVATRRSAERRAEHADGVDMLYPAAELHAVLAESDFVVVAAMHTPETEGMIDRAAFDAMKVGAVLINIARGKIVDEQALIAALRSGRLAGAALDVYGDDFHDLANPPNPELTALPNVFVTPHVSGRTEVADNQAVDVFCRNLAHLLAGEPLENQIDWERGY
ncbi:MAG: hypothetical protein FJ318_07020 [SAR202 cluster bacterium]|nr:hypothetical protein [SAR202 cluster bacterium]